MLQLEVALEFRAIESAQDRIADWGAAQGVPERAVLTLRLVLEELLVNLVQHGRFAGDPPPARLDLAAEPGMLRVGVEDAAAFFDPRSVAEPAAASVDDDRVGGLGLALVRRMTRGLTYGAAADGWNRTAFAILWASTTDAVVEAPVIEPSSNCNRADPADA